MISNSSLRKVPQFADTVGAPGGIHLPTGAGIGATQLVWEVMSFTRAMGFLQAITEVEPIAIMPGPPGTHPGSIHGND